MAATKTTRLHKLFRILDLSPLDFSFFFISWDFNRKEFPDSLLRGFLISPERAYVFVLKKFVIVGALTN